MSFESYNSPEQADEHIVAENFAKMNTEMRKVLRSESIGGNAGSIQIEGKAYGCAGANAYVNPVSGRIEVFGNIQDIPSELTAGKALLNMRVAFSMEVPTHGGFFRIVEVFGLDKLGAQARKAIEASIDEYNSLSIKKTRKVNGMSK